MTTFNENFKNPSRRYALFPIVHDVVATDEFVKEGYPYNTKLAKRLNSLTGLSGYFTVNETDGQVKKSIADKLEELGFAGVVGHAPYGPNYPNDKGDWESVKTGFQALFERSMTAWIYDENGYPSGTAGGLVVDENLDFIAEGMYCYEYWRPISGPISYRADIPGDKLFRAMLIPLSGDEALDITHTLDPKGVLRIEIPDGDYQLLVMSSRRLFDGTHAAESYGEPRNYISLSDKEATEAFIKATHQKYAEYFSEEFGKGLLAFFTDEPSLISWNIRKGVMPILPWHRNYPDEFSAKYGYPIELAMVAVLKKSGPEYIKRRCDFWEFIGESVAENFFGTIQDWCRQHGIKSSGHFLWEEELQTHVSCYGSLYKCAKRMDWPGIDQLESEPQNLMNPHGIPIARLLSSFADISGEKETFTEFSAFTSLANNKHIGTSWIRASINWHYAMGINNLTSYYILTNYKDEEVKEINQYAARLGYLIRQGRRFNRVAVLYPEASIWSAYTPSTEYAAKDSSEDTVLVDKTFAKISWELLNRQIDFDYADEQLLQDGIIQDKKLVYNHNSYECVILPAAHVLSIKTVEKIVMMAEAGIGIVFIGDFPKFDRDTGEPASFQQMLSKYQDKDNFTIIPLGNNWNLPNMKNIPAIPRTITITPESMDCVRVGSADFGGYVDGEIISANILSHVRKLDNGDMMVFLCNMGAKTYKGSLCVQGGYAVKIANPNSGDITDIQSQCENGVVTVNISLRPYDGFCYIIESEKGGS